MQHSLRHQRGLSFVSVVLIGFILVAAFAIGGQSVPIFTEYMAVQKAAQKAADEATSVTELRAAGEIADQMRKQALVEVEYASVIEAHAVPIAGRPSLARGAQPGVCATKNPPERRVGRG